LPLSLRETGPKITKWKLKHTDTNGFLIENGIKYSLHAFTSLNDSLHSEKQNETL
jgi:hypothetical protein